MDGFDGNLQENDFCGSALEKSHWRARFHFLEMGPNPLPELQPQSPCTAYRHQIRPLRQTYHLRLPSGQKKKKKKKKAEDRKKGGK
jgi:hypothetical protein